MDSFVKAAKAVQQALELELPPEHIQLSAPPAPEIGLRAKIEDAIKDIIMNCSRALDPLRKLLGIFEPLVLARFTTTTNPTP